MSRARMIFSVIAVLTLTFYFGNRNVTAHDAGGLGRTIASSMERLSRGASELLFSVLGATAARPGMAPGITMTATTSGCYYTGGQSRATISVEVSWTDLADGQSIAVVLGATTRTININSGGNPPIVSPQVVAFEVTADGSGQTITATYSADNNVTATATPTAPAACAPLVCGANDIGGTVFNDYNADGIKQAGETNGVSGITVKAYDRSGASYTTTTNSAGRYCLAVPLANYPARVEFTGIPSDFSGGYATPQGTDGRTSVQFVAAPDGNVDLGVNNPIDYCQANPMVMTPCYVFGDPLATTGNAANDASAEPAMVRFAYNLDGVETGEAAIASAAEIGSVWALAFRKQTRHLFTAATIRRHSGLGPQGIGGIYVLNPFGANATGNVIDSWSVETQLAIDMDDAMAPFGGSATATTSNTNRGLSPNKTLPSQDADAFSAVGKLGFGDIDISDDGNTLWFVNQYDKKLYSVDITNYDPNNTATRPTPSNVNSYTIPDPGCTGGSWRPAGTKYRRGTVYVGGVCDALTSQSLGDLRASVYAYSVSGNTWTPIFNFPLSYPKGSPLGTSGEKGWHPWSDTWTTIVNGGGNSINYSVPMFTDIEFDVDGSMVLGFNDRTGMQTGRANYSSTAASGSFNGFTGGDALRAYFSNGTYVLENNAKAGPITGYAADNNEGPGFGEFYEDNWRTDGHTETIVGGLAIRPGSGEVAVTSMDPHDASIWAAGVRYLSNSTGLRTHAFAVYSDSNDTPSLEVGKSTGVGDIELTCDTINYNEVGSRLWRDDNRNGIQDPQEPPIAGVTVTLKDSNNTVIATAVTDSNGEYFFSNASGTNTASAKYNLGGYGNDGIANTMDDTPGLKPSAGQTINTYRICLETAGDYVAGGKLYGMRLTQANAAQPANNNAADSSDNAQTDVADSDATLASPSSLPAAANAPTITFTTGAVGWVNHGFDIGMWAYDLGDAPDPTFATLITNDGARHVLTNGVYLGSSVDGEPDGLQNAMHNGDDATGTPDDEDGVTLPVMAAGTTANISVSASVAGYLNAWIDFNNDGDWSDAGEQVFTDQALTAGTNSLMINVPNSAVIGTLCSRWRFVQASDGVNAVNSPTGEALSGEVEDHPVVLIKASIGNQVFFDTNNNGVREVGENGINGVTVELYADANMDGSPDTSFPLDRRTTATAGGEAGMYLFTQQTLDTSNGTTLGTPVNLPPGKYVVCIPASMFSTAAPLEGYFSSRTTKDNAGAGFTEGASPDPNAGAGGNPGVDSDDNGTRVASGGYVGAVCSGTIDISGNEPLAESPDNDAITPDAYENLTVDFGFYTMSAGNIVFKDFANDGILNGSDTGLAGITVRLYAADMTTLLATAVTDANGRYIFRSLAEGQYQLEVLTPTGYMSSLAEGGSTNPNDATDSDDNGVLFTILNDVTGPVRTSNSNKIVLDAGAEPTGESDNATGIGSPAVVDPTPDANSDKTLDFGFTPTTMTLGNQVWKDANSNGVRDGNESGIASVRLNLYRDTGDQTFNSATDTLVGSLTTNSQGQYQFTGLAPGNYFVQVDVSNFTSGGALVGCVSSYRAATANNDQDDDTNGSNNSNPSAAPPVSTLISLVSNGEPTTDGDGDQGNNTIDFGFVNPVAMQVASTAVCLGSGSTMAVTSSMFNAGAGTQNDNPGPEMVINLPPTLAVVGTNCQAQGGTGACTVVNKSQVVWNGSLPAGQRVTLSYIVQVSNQAAGGDNLCIPVVANFDADLNGSNETPVTSQSCLQANCAPVGPGIQTDPGCSVLIYPIYTSSPINSAAQNTRINLTNINPSLEQTVHLFFVDGATCTVADSYICLTPNQTTSFFVSDFDPGTTGYLVAVNVDAQTGCPINSNYLLGDEYVKFESGHAANLKAECIVAIAGGLPACDGNSPTATLNFDGVSYSQLPRSVAISNLPDRASGNDTMLILNSPTGNLATGMDRIGSIFGLVYDDAESVFSFSFSPGGCQFRNSISNSFPRTAPRIETIIPAGRTGWMKMWQNSDAPLVGAVINFNPNTTSASGAFNQGHNLQTLTQTATGRVTIPVFPASCR